MKKLLLVCIALLVAGAFSYTPALTQETKPEAKPETTEAKPKPKRSAERTASTSPQTVKRRPINMSVGARTAACRKDCSSGNLHGTYRAYGANDPKLISPEARKLYAECVRLCLDPLPGFYVQRSIVESGGSWFGQTKADCLGCHAQGAPKRNWPGINTLPDALRR
jgi:hypothetical protein